MIYCLIDLPPLNLQVVNDNELVSGVCVVGFLAGRVFEFCVPRSRCQWMVLFCHNVRCYHNYIALPAAFIQATEANFQL